MEDLDLRVAVSPAGQAVAEHLVAQVVRHLQALRDKAMRGVPQLRTCLMAEVAVAVLALLGQALLAMEAQAAQA